MSLKFHFVRVNTVNMANAILLQTKNNAYIILPADSCENFWRSRFPAIFEGNLGHFTRNLVDLGRDFDSSILIFADIASES